MLRGGYGIFYQHDVRIGSESVLGENPPAFYDQSLAQSAGSTTPVFFLKNGFPGNPVRPADSEPDHSCKSARRIPTSVLLMSSRSASGRNGRFSQSTVLDVSYVGNFGRKENRLRNANQGLVTGFAEWRSGHGSFLTRISAPT